MMHPAKEEYLPITSALQEQGSSILGIRTMTAMLPLFLAVILRADDWPQWRGTHRDNVWDETGILQSFPAEGLKVLWRVPVGTGFSSPVESNRVSALHTDAPFPSRADQ